MSPAGLLHQKLLQGDKQQTIMLLKDRLSRSSVTAYQVDEVDIEAPQYQVEDPIGEHGGCGE